MTIFIIVLLAVALFAVWRGGREALERVRGEIPPLERQIDGLRVRMAALERTLAAQQERIVTLSARAEGTAAQSAPAQAESEHREGAPDKAPAGPAVPEESKSGQEAFKSAPAAWPQAAQKPSAPGWAPAAPPISTPSPRPAAAGAAEPAPAGRFFSLEERLGANWLNKLGIAMVVIGLAFFLAVKLETWGPAGKVLCGYAVSAALLGGGVWLERRATYRILARAGIGGGWALAFFTTFAMHHIAAARVLQSLGADLVLMLLVAAGMVAHSLRYRSQTVTGLAFLLGFFTLITSHLQADEGTVAFSLTASVVLAVAMVGVTSTRHWAWLELAGMAAVYAGHLVWLTRVLPAEHAAFQEFWPSTLLILLYWAIFRAAYLLRRPGSEQEEHVSSLSAILNSGGVLGLLKYQSAHPEWAFWVLAAMGAVEMALAWWARPRRRPAFVVLSTIAAVLLVAAIPFKFHGVSWPVLWLVEAQALVICGMRLGEPVFRRLGLLAGLATGVALAFHDVLPLALLRLGEPDPGRHWALTLALGLAAVLYWIHGEVYARRWPLRAQGLTADDAEVFGLRIVSWLGLAAAAAALWVVLPSAWVAPGWLLLVLTLGFAADGFKVESLALEADLLALAGICGLFAWDLWTSGVWGHKAPLAATVALLYAGMRRKTVLAGSPEYVAPAYSWVATLLWAFLAADLATSLALAAVWAALGLALFEAGRFVMKGCLRWQGFFLVGLGFLRYGLVDLGGTGGMPAPGDAGAAGGQFSLVHSLLVEVLVLAASGYWLLERTRDHDLRPRRERVAGLVADALGTLSIALWFAYRFPSYWVPAPGGEFWVAAIWAGMATVLMALAWPMRRRTFLSQAVALGVAAVARGLLFNLTAPAGPGFWNGTLLQLSVTAAILIAALPLAFRLRRPEFWWGFSITWPKAVDPLLRRPEQWFFFLPFVLEGTALAAKLSSGHITIAWSLLGVGTFLFALAVGERSYRLAGLGLLLVSVVKIVLVDVWALSATDRYTTLIVLGLALVAVSFLYTRFRPLIRRYL